MARGVIGIDTIVGLGIFITVVGMAFAIYIQSFPSDISTLKIESDIIAESIIDYMTADAADVPVTYASALPVQNAVLYFNFSWPYGAESTKVISPAGGYLDCMLSGNSVFFKGDLSAGLNIFTMAFSDIQNPIGCSAIIPTTGAKVGVPLTSQAKKRLSGTKVNQLFAMPYKKAREDLRLGRDFRIEMYGGTRNYGLLPPPNTNVFTKEKVIELAEDPLSTADVKVYVW
ncbi:MAG: hypothetical protein HY518_04010 [Candidatus Aenigmarchaeota archaeon]|nr:hypothetical protein [Candidatus Aenigmarchaeota archaeon]